MTVFWYVETPLRMCWMWSVIFHNHGACSSLPRILPAMSACQATWIIQPDCLLRNGMCFLLSSHCCSQRASSGEQDVGVALPPVHQSAASLTYLLLTVLAHSNCIGLVRWDRLPAFVWQVKWHWCLFSSSWGFRFRIAIVAASAVVLRAERRPESGLEGASRLVMRLHRLTNCEGHGVGCLVFTTHKCACSLCSLPSSNAARVDAVVFACHAIMRVDFCSPLQWNVLKTGGRCAAAAMILALDIPSRNRAVGAALSSSLIMWATALSCRCDRTISEQVMPSSSAAQRSKQIEWATCHKSLLFVHAIPPVMNSLIIATKI